jgi:hypothetical protein
MFTHGLLIDISIILVGFKKQRQKRRCFFVEKYADLFSPCNAP